MGKSPSATALAGRALITGGTSGIGLEFARQLASRGNPLVLVARDAERLERTCEQLRWRYGVEVEPLAADLTSEEDRVRVAERLADETKPVGILVNNAGMGLHHPLVTDDVRPHRTAMDLMAWCVLELGAAAGLAMKKRGEGIIINTASVSGLVPMGGYSALKAWVRVYSDSLYLQLADSGVHVTTFMPGWVRTEHHARAGISTSNIPDFLWLDLEKLVASCLADTAKGKVRSTPSLRYKVISFAAEHGPKAAVRAVAQKINRGRK